MIIGIPGTQFDEFGMLADCEFTHCSILDDDSRSGFVDMAQCVNLHLKYNLIILIN